MKDDKANEVIVEALRRKMPYRGSEQSVKSISRLAKGVPSESASLFPFVDRTIIDTSNNQEISQVACLDLTHKCITYSFLSGINFCEEYAAKHAAGYHYWLYKKPGIKGSADIVYYPPEYWQAVNEYPGLYDFIGKCEAKAYTLDYKLPPDPTGVVAFLTKIAKEAWDIFWAKQVGNRG